MGIISVIGNVGSGKTIWLVRKMMQEKKLLPTFTNVHVEGVENTVELKAEMILKKSVVESTELKNGKIREKFSYIFNLDYWETVPRPCNVYLDEAGLLVKARRAMADTNIAVQEFISLSRKICSDEFKTGDLIMTSQRIGLIDESALMLSNQIIYCMMLYTKYCDKCKVFWGENSEMPKPAKTCPKCGNFDLKKTNFTMRVREFGQEGRYALQDFEDWWVSRDDDIPEEDYFIEHCEKYFPKFYTRQLKNMFAGFSKIRVQTREPDKSDIKENDDIKENEQRLKNIKESERKEKGIEKLNKKEFNKKIIPTIKQNEIPTIKKDKQKKKEKKVLSEWDKEVEKIKRIRKRKQEEYDKMELMNNG